MKKNLLSLFAFPIAFCVSAQVNLLQNGDMEEQGAWMISQGNLSDTIWYEFGSTENTVNGGEGANLAIKHIPSVAEADNITIYQTLELVGGKEYLWHCAMRDLSPALQDCWWTSFSWFDLEPVDGIDPEEKPIARMNQWEFKTPGFNGLWDTATVMISAESKDNIFIPEEDGIYYVGINFGTCIVSEAGDFHFLYDEIALIDQDMPSALNKKIIDRGNSLKVYPNPAATTIYFSYTVSEKSDVELVLINILGQEVAIVLKDLKGKGSYTESFDCSNLTDGIYYGVLKVNNSLIKTKIMVLKK